MSATARKSSSKPSSPRRAAKRPKVPAEVASLLEKRFAKMRAELTEAFVAMERRLAERAATDPIAPAATSPAGERRATPAQMVARRRALEEALEHTPSASDEAVRAIIDEWG